MCRISNGVGDSRKKFNNKRRICARTESI